MKRLMIMGALAPLIAMAAADAGGGSGQAPLTLIGAINALDVAKDADWTEGGEPAMKRIKELMGTDEVTRADVDAVLPEGFNRANAYAAPKLEGDEHAATFDQGSGSTSPSTFSDAEAAALGGDPSTTGNEADQGMGVMAEPLTGTALAVSSILQNCFNGKTFDAVALMEAVVAAAQDDRYRRNSALQNVVRGYQVSQAQIKDVQGRLDARISDRAEKNAASRAATAAEASA